MYDYDAFHAPAGTFDSRNYLYLDGHVNVAGTLMDQGRSAAA